MRGENANKSPPGRHFQSARGVYVFKKNVGAVFGRIYLVQVKHHQPDSLSSYLYILLFTLTLFDKSDIIKDEKDRDGGGVNKRGHGLPHKINAEKDNPK